jgi:hypothetical protein
MNTVERVTQESENGDRTAERRVVRRRLVDALNYVNFRKDSVIVNLEHVRYGSILSLRAVPEPCTGEALSCLWTDVCPPNVAMHYVFRNLMVDRGLDLLVVDGEAAELTDESITLVLPVHCRALQPRKAKRHACVGVQATLMQDGASFAGSLEEFTVLSFRVLLSAQPPLTFEWISIEHPVYVILSDGKDTLYSAECKIVRQTDTKQLRAFVLEPVEGEHRTRHDRTGSEGHSLAPHPGVVFDHPLTGKKIRLEVDRISPCWFSVVERYDASVLFPGLVIPAIEIEAVPGFAVTCRGQVSRGILRNGDGEKHIEWRIIVVDMGIEDQGKLFAWLQRLVHRKSHSYGSIDLEDLLTFFFDTGFVYPEKYEALRSKREEFKETYRKLYLENPAIARHFIQMDKGAIQGHLSMIRFYQNTWMMHHHASTGEQGAGLAVLREVTDYVNDYRYLYSSHMDYLICYFRPNNRFPNRMFGGFARVLNNLQECSVDSFAYFNLEPPVEAPVGGDCLWGLHASTKEDLSELRNFYERTSGGLLVKALDLEPERIDADGLNMEYRNLGFKRERTLYSLKKGDQLKAVFMALVSDVGLNMSNLTNCVHVFVIDQNDLPLDQLYRHLGALGPRYAEGEMAVLLHPVSFADQWGVSYEKIYNLWAFDTKHTDRFYEYMEGIREEKRSRTK